MDLPFFNPSKKKEKDTDCWCHADQDIRLKEGGGHPSHQGILYVWDSTQHNSSNTILWPKSWDSEYHKLIKCVPSNVRDGHGLYVDKVTDNKVKKDLMDGWVANARRIQVPKGSLLIFNSRTIHQGYPCGYRLAQTISWEPRKYRNDDALHRKLQAIHRQIGTTHWASLGIHHGASFVRSRKENYSTDHMECVFPMKTIHPVPAKEILPWKNSSSDEMMNALHNEYKDCI